MSDLNNDLFEEMLNDYLPEEKKSGDVITGIITRKDMDFAYLDLSGKQEGRILIREVEDFNVGDTIEVKVLRNDEEYVIVSKFLLDKAREFLSYEVDEIVTGTILKKIKGGYSVRVGKNEAFLPFSLASLERDKFEIMLLEEYLKTGKPILAICRGLQLVNIYFGGTLYQDIKYLDTQIQHKQKWHLYLPTHNIDILGKDNILYEIFGEKTRVNSFHHQMIKDLAEGLTPIAKSSDGVIEALQKKDHPFFYATQWHPEMMAVRGNDEMKKIFDKFVEACE